MDFDFDSEISLRIHELVGGERDAPVFQVAEAEVKWVGEELLLWHGKEQEAAVDIPADAAPAVAAGPADADPHGDDLGALPIEDGDPLAFEGHHSLAESLATVAEQFAAEQVSLIFSKATFIIITAQGSAMLPLRCFQKMSPL